MAAGVEHSALFRHAEISRPEQGKQAHLLMNALLTMAHAHTPHARGYTMLGSSEERMKAFLSTTNPFGFDSNGFHYQISHNQTEPIGFGLGINSKAEVLRLYKFAEEPCAPGGKQFSHVASTELRTRYFDDIHRPRYVDGDITTTVSEKKEPYGIRYNVTRASHGLYIAECVFGNF